MKDILFSIAVPLSGLITYVLGIMSGKRSKKAEADKLELGNYQTVVNFYKSTFRDLTEEIHKSNQQIIKLNDEIIKLTVENKKLRMDLENFINSKK